tara:strand:- start:401 stop:886 length:486 start_codon:yes stop_codon:yes gene_type:complete
MFKRKKVFDFEIAKQSIRKYCSFQERCQSEVKNRLVQMGLSIQVVDNILSDLILEGYISEERYAKAYVRGKFKIKKWGRIKIKQSLISKRVTFKCIEIGLLEIDEIEYRNCLESLISKRLLISTQKDSKSALLKYFQNRGFENHLILELIQEKVDSPSNKT